MPAAVAAATPAGRTWLREHPALAVAACATLVAACAFALTRPVLLVVDGHMYFEMARSMRHGSLEVANGLDVVDSPELWIENSIKRGPHIYSKYPPIFALLAVGPVALFGISGLYLLNAAGFVLSLLAIHALARRVLGPERALLATALAPLALPLVPYMLMELPHLTALAPFAWALVLWDDARQAAAPRRAALRAVGAGLLVGLGFGIRIQDVVFMAPLVALGFVHARRRGWVVAGLLAGFAVCLAAVGAFNAARFGSPNPFSYGPRDSSLGVPYPEDGAGHFLRPAFVVVVGLGLGALVAVRRGRGPWRYAWPVAVAVVVTLVPSLRAVAIHTLGTTASLLLGSGAAGAGWDAPDTTLGWIDKALLSSTPLLGLGLAAIVLARERDEPPLLTAFAWMTVVLLLFLSVRDPDPRTQRGAMGFMSLSPRYLVEVMPGLYLLAWDRLRALRLRPAHAVAGAIAGIALLVFMLATERDDLSPAKSWVITTASVATAGLLLAAYAARRSRAGAAALGGMVALAIGYAAAAAFGEDARCLRDMAATDALWGDRILAAMPEPEVSLVGWHYAKDPVFHVRASKSVVTVDPEVDDSADLVRTLDALNDRGRVAYYFGLGLERVAPHLEGRYRVVPVLTDPLLWRFDRLRAPPMP